MCPRPSTPTAQGPEGDLPPLPLRSAWGPLRTVPSLLAIAALVAGVVFPQYAKPLITVAFLQVAASEVLNFVERRRWKMGLTSLDALDAVLLSCLIVGALNLWIPGWGWWAYSYLGVAGVGGLIYLLVTAHRDRRRLDALIQSTDAVLRAAREERLRAEATLQGTDETLTERVDRALAAERERDRDGEGE